MSMGDFSGDLMFPRENSLVFVFFFAVETYFSSTSNHENLPDVLRLNVKFTIMQKLTSLLHVFKAKREPVINLLQKVGKRFVV